ncbi:MAG: hypothetical protein LBG91_04575 [Treponema sp.]|jgi:hypothetical protein|nr:hypothetical protein [Treponema sp.]
MVNKKLWLGILVMLLVFGMTVVGCTTTVPVLYTDNPNKEFTILGEVTYEGYVNQWTGRISFGYIELLKAAKAKYPDCDYVIDIMIDAKETLSFFVFLKTGYSMRGTAIKYKTE